MIFESVVHVDRVIWISSLGEDEVGVSRRIIEELDPYFGNINLPFEKNYPKSLQDLRGLLDNIAASSIFGRGPIVHFDMHGTKDKGLFLASCKLYVPWENLAIKLSQINSKTGNNLVVVLATCFGYNLIKSLDLAKPSPFYMVIAPEKTVSAGFLEDHIPAFYMEVFDASNPLQAYKKHLATAMRMLHSEEILAYLLIKYFQSSCLGKAGETRRERLLTEIMQSGAAANVRSNRRILRKSLKMQIRPSQAIVDRYIEIFLMGKKVSYRLIDLVMSARDLLDAGKHPTVRF